MGKSIRWKLNDASYGSIKWRAIKLVRSIKKYVIRIKLIYYRGIKLRSLEKSFK